MTPRPLPAHYCAACHWPLACTNADCPTVAKSDAPRPDPSSRCIACGRHIAGGHAVDCGAIAAPVVRERLNKSASAPRSAQPMPDMPQFSAREWADLLRALRFVSNDHVFDPYTTGEFASIREAEAFAERCGDLLYRLTPLAPEPRAR